MEKSQLQTVWLILGGYGVWFAIFSGLEEIGSGKYWKAGLSLLFGLIIYLLIYSKAKGK